MGQAALRPNRASSSADRRCGKSSSARVTLPSVDHLPEGGSGGIDKAGRCFAEYYDILDATFFDQKIQLIAKG